VSEADLLVKERYRERAHAFGAIPLLVRSRLLRRAAAITAGEVMTTGVKTIGPDVTLSTTVRRLLGENLRGCSSSTSRACSSACWPGATCCGSRCGSRRTRPSCGSPTARSRSRGQLDRRSEVERASLLTAQIPGVVAVHDKLTFGVDDVSAAHP